jgi:hypothetical protein
MLHRRPNKYDKSVDYYEVFHRPSTEHDFQFNIIQDNKDEDKHKVSPT